MWNRHLCSLRFFVGWLVATNRQWNRISYKQRTDPPQTIIFGRFKHWRFLDDDHTKSMYSPSASIDFPLEDLSFQAIVYNGVYLIFTRVRKSSAQRKPTKHKERPYQIFKRKLLASKALAALGSSFSSCHQPIVLISRVWLPFQVQNSYFQTVKFSKTTRTEFIRWKRKISKFLQRLAL